MTTDQVAVLAITTGAVVAVVLVVALVVLGRRVRDLGHLVEELRRETVPLVRDARVVVDQAATEMVRVGDVLESAEAVSATVDSASRLAYRAFSNPVVKVLAYATGTSSAVRRFFDRRAARPTASARPPTRTHLAPLARGAPAPLPGASPSSPARTRRARAHGGRHVGVPAAAAGRERGGDPPAAVAHGRRRPRGGGDAVDAPARPAPVAATLRGHAACGGRFAGRPAGPECGRPRARRHGGGTLRRPAPRGRSVACGRHP